MTDEPYKRLWTGVEYRDAVCHDESPNADLGSAQSMVGFVFFPESDPMIRRTGRLGRVADFR